MSGVYEFVLLLLFCHLTPLLLADGYQPKCPPSFDCGYLGNISFPFTITERKDCGLLPIRNCHSPALKMIQLQKDGKWFQVVRVTQLLSSPTTTYTTFQFRDTNLNELLQNQNCEAFRNSYTLPHHTFPFASFSMQYTTTVYRCNRNHHVTLPPRMSIYTNCSDYNIYYGLFPMGDDASLRSLRGCTKVQLPVKDVPDAKNPFTFITSLITTRVNFAK
ncbi:LEAF RUST 10 DISEASE-RESISTANCE LOCUS RECEPTOR-LIKE PROTEIN KINASE-like 1.1 [Cajanus cajan]|uniref:Wall-associated receptor kinase galacturonan-binding domain-containing protein n=1 Tax=Cajanus cajan TaxID=3821 RepID=A0A151U791_CAJCA|nr:LEAF RUST 10 DISEASE-RESISTANCE LOCUS RECEPTOR-LIKE PROTEIN KINASE-like 1.1 [Cajanus cajan]KYP75138.1 hypothetical protein KK1_007838 [Cajanus cajan]